MCSYWDHCLPKQVILFIPVFEDLPPGLTCHDYFLLRPFQQPRNQSTVFLIKREQVQSFFFIRHDGRNVKVDFDNILYIEARKNYTRLVLQESPPFLVLITLKQWERILPPHLFCRIHRGYIVSVGKVLAFDNKYVYLSADRISIGEQYRNALSSMVTIVASEPSRKDVFSELEL